jgi:hypothetical protein
MVLAQDLGAQEHFMKALVFLVRGCRKGQAVVEA